MKKYIILGFNLLLICSLVFGIEKEKRDITTEDIFNFKTIRQPTFSPDGKWIAYIVTTMDKEKNSYNSDIWMIPSQGGEAIQITNNEAGDSSPCWSPDGKYLAFISIREKRSQIWLFNTLGGEPYQLTKIKTGVRSFVWSPDSARLAFIAKDAKPEEKNEKDKDNKTKKPEVIVVNRLQHKRDGVGYLDNRHNHIWLISVAGGEPKKLTDGQYDEGNINFSPDGKEIIFTSNRTENPDANKNTDIWALNIANGKIRQLTTNRGGDFNPVCSHSGKHVTYSANTIFNSLYGITYLFIIPSDGGEPINLTANIDRNISSIPVWSSDDNYIYFILEDSGNWHLCCISPTNEKMERIIAGERTIRNPVISPDGKFIAFTLEDALSPAELYISQTNGEGLKKLTSLNDELISQLKLSKPENIHYKSFDGQEIEGWIIKPIDFQPGRKYPMILKAHGGPQGQYGNYFSLEFQLLAAEGYVVLYTNPRGSTGYGYDFGQAIRADWGNKDLKDVIAGVDYVIEKGYVDPDRIGISGWSYGGMMTNFGIVWTDRFKAAVSGASVADYFGSYGYDDCQNWWETELGLPWENFELYRRLSPIKDVENVKTPTLFMCGQNDYRCPLPQSEQMYLSLKRLGVDTELIIYPGESHGISQPDHLVDRLNRIIQWFNKYLQPDKEAKNKSRK
jgi:dipeptidyl aminopeptidase/acylaminoacyl peptidase